MCSAAVDCFKCPKPSPRLRFSFLKLLTDRVRSTRGGYIFSLSVSSHLGGVPHPADGGGGGYPIQLMGGGTPSQVQMGGGVPHPRSRQGGAHPGYPPPGVPPAWKGVPAWGTPLPGRGVPAQSTPLPGRGHLPGVPPPTWQGAPAQGTPPPQQEQHSVYMLCGGRYASCVHAGGLSCL